MARSIQNVSHSAVSEDERRRGLEVVAYARASVRLEGFIPSAEAEDLARRYVDGEIDMVEFVKVSRRAPTAHRNEGTGADRQKIEADSTFIRIAELRDKPVRGDFDAAHLREINRRIFQDLPGLGFADVTPGQYRPPVKGSGDWIKTRGFETIPQASHVAYSRMDDAARVKLNKTLDAIYTLELSKLHVREFTQALAKIYTELDYLHPFSDGNSRTLREFTRQIADAAGYRVEWEWFARAPVGRDLLYIGRDLSVNEQALPEIGNQGTRRDVQYTLDMFEGNRALPDLLSDAVRRRPEGQ